MSDDGGRFSAGDAIVEGGGVEGVVWRSRAERGDVGDRQMTGARRKAICADSASRIAGRFFLFSSTMDPSPDAPVKRRKTSHSTGDSVDKPVKEKKDKKEKKEKKDRKDRKEKKAKKAVQPSDVPKEPAKPAATDSASEAEEPAQDDLATIETEDVPAIEKAVVAGSPIQKPEAAVEPVVQKTFADLVHSSHIF